MTLFNLIPTCDNPMSVYTVCAFAIVITGGITFAAIYLRYTSNEFRRIDGWINHDITKLEAAINGHDEYIDDTNRVITKMQIDLAVQESSLEAIKSDIAEIKALILNINNTLMEMR